LVEKKGIDTSLKVDNLVHGTPSENSFILVLLKNEGVWLERLKNEGVWLERLKRIRYSTLWSDFGSVTIPLFLLYDLLQY